MTNNEKIQRAEQLIAEANALLNEVKSVQDSKEDVIAKYKDDYNEGRQYYLNGYGLINFVDNSGTFEEIKERTKSPYQHYLTEELAEQAKKLKDFNDKLLAFKYCYDLDYEPVFSVDCFNCAYYVYYNTLDCKYDYCNDSIHERNTVYFSTKEIAQKCCDWLNSLSK